MKTATRAWNPAARTDRRFRKPSGTRRKEAPRSRDLALRDGSRIAVIGGGPAGSFFAYFLLDMASRVDLSVSLDLYEPKDFSSIGPGGCNMCGGIVSESLVQALAADGINIPASVVERGIDSYVLHMEEGSVRIATPLAEKRIAAVHRGAGPRGMQTSRWGSFDAFLLDLAIGKGAHRKRERVEGLGLDAGRPAIRTRQGSEEPYDLLVVAAGVNSSLLGVLEGLPIGYRKPLTTKTYICEFLLGQETVTRCLGSAMHIFLLSLPRLEFAALIPKGDYVTVCLLGREIDGALVRSFLDAPQVRRSLPDGWQIPADFCHCSPRINIGAAREPFADRIVCVGDCGVARLYKDGIGSAYRTAKAAAVTSLFEGISADDFRRHYGPACESIDKDNVLGRVIFRITEMQQKRAHDRRGILRMVAREQRNGSGARPMSTALWDVFTGSAAYREVVLRALHPSFVGRLVWEVIAGSLRGVPLAVRENGR